MNLTASTSGFYKLTAKVGHRKLAYFGTDREQLRARLRADIGRMYFDDAQSFYFHEARLCELYGLPLTELHLSAIEAENNLQLNGGNTNADTMENF